MGPGCLGAETHEELVGGASVLREDAIDTVVDVELRLEVGVVTIFQVVILHGVGVHGEVVRMHRLDKVGVSVSG